MKKDKMKKDKMKYRKLANLFINKFRRFTDDNNL